MICPAWTVPLHVALCGKFEVGVNVNELAGEANGKKEIGPPQSNRNALGDALTGSLKLMTMVEATATLVAPLSGAVAVGACSPAPWAMTEKSSMPEP